MSKQTDTDEKYMARAIALAYEGLGDTYPNPAVGCVIVSDGEIIGEDTIIGQGCRTPK